MRGYTFSSFDRELAVERAKAASVAFRESSIAPTVPEPPVPVSAVSVVVATKPAVGLHKDSMYLTPEPKVPPNVIWMAAGLVFLGVVLWSAYATIKSCKRIEYLERFVQMLAERQGIYVNGF